MGEVYRKREEIEGVYRTLVGNP